MALLGYEPLGAMKAWGSRGSGCELLEQPPPTAKPGTCVVRMAAVGLNPTDWKHVGNNLHYYTMTKATAENPVILGSEGSGVIESVSQGETKFQVGQKVWFMATRACAELVEVQNQHMAIAPTQMSMEEAGSTPLALLTAYQSMKDAGFSEPGSGKGKRILVHAGAGGVGHFALQLAKIYQFDEIVTTCSSANADFVKSMGATSMEDFVTKFANAKFDVVFDPVGGEPVGCCCAASNALAQYTPRSRKVTKVGGTVIGIITGTSLQGPCGVVPALCCSCLPALFAIGWILQTCRLAPCQESAALRALRDCCCLLTDLFEQAGREVPRQPLETRAEVPLEEAPAPGEVKTEESKEPAEAAGEARREDREGEEPKVSKKEKKDKKDKKKDHKRDKRREAEPGDGSPVKKESKERKKHRAEEPHKEEIDEEEGEEEAEAEDEEARATGSVPDRRPLGPEELQERVDTWVTRNPGAFELATLPARSAASRDGGEPEAPDRSRRPPEPDHPPPGDHGRRGGDEEIPRRRAPAPKKNKGQKHYQRGAEPERSVQDLWLAGREVEACKVPPLELGEGVRVAMDSAVYYHQECKVAGTIQGLEVREGEASLRLTLMGTTHEGILKLQSGAPEMTFRVHLCPAGCNQEVSDTLLHARKIRLLKEVEKESGWVTNLQKVAALQGPDELAELRRREAELGLAGLPGGPAPCVEPGEDKKKKKKKQKKDKKEEKAKPKEKKPRAEEEISSSSESVKLDGSRAKAAAKKQPMSLFSGTGLDPREKVRRKVSKKARRALTRKGKKEDSSRSSRSSSSSVTSLAEEGDESVFQQSSKVRMVAIGYPGALATQALAQMRSNLLLEIGAEDRPGSLRACAVSYFRQQLARKATGPAQRELLTIAASVDQLLNGNAAGAMDILLQRLKSCESSLMGTHWSVSQRLEVVPQENTQLTPLPEMGVARKDVYEESRLKWLTAQPDGRGGQSSTKGGNKGKTDYKEGGKGGKDRRGGKGPQTKGDAGKKKEEGAGKT
eukprot:s184_g19.t3